LRTLAIGLTTFTVLGLLNAPYIFVGCALAGIYIWHLFNFLYSAMSSPSHQNNADDGRRRIASNGEIMPLQSMGMMRSNVVSHFETESLLSIDDPSKQDGDRVIEYSHMMEIMLKMKKRTFREWNNSSWIYRFFYFIEIPFKYLIQLTIVPVETPLFSHYQKYLYSFTTPATLVLFRGLLCKSLLTA